MGKKSTKIVAKPADILLGAKIDKLNVEREQWELEVARTNKQLYAILAECLDIWDYLTKNRKSISDLNDILTARGLDYQKNTPVPTKIIKAVFGSDRRRSHAYSKVLIAARDKKKPSDNLADWITRMGGIEAIRLNKTKKSAKDEEAALVRYAGDACKALVEIPALPAASSDFASVAQTGEMPRPYDNIVLLFGVVKNDGTVSIVSFADDPDADICAQALAKLGKQLDTEKSRQETDQAQADLTQTVGTAAAAIRERMKSAETAPAADAPLPNAA